MKIELFVSPGCSHRDQALAVVSEAAAESGHHEPPRVVTVGDYGDAKTLRSFGSPTVRVDGVDVEYGEREPEEFSTGCRFYNSPEGWQPVPRKEMVKRGIEAAQRRQVARGQA